jgi:hypothetical protein
MAGPTIAAPAGLDLTTVSQTLYTVPAGNKAYVEAIVANIDGVNSVNVTLAWTDASATSTINYIAFGQPVAAGDGFVSARKTLEAGDTITGYASANGDAHASINVLWLEVL